MFGLMDDYDKDLWSNEIWKKKRKPFIYIWNTDTWVWKTFGDLLQNFLLFIFIMNSKRLVFERHECAKHISYNWTCMWSSVLLSDLYMWVWFYLLLLGYYYSIIGLVKMRVGWSALVPFENSYRRKIDSCSKFLQSINPFRVMES